jgi:DNA-binding MarR family transcriptional regulator
MWRGQEEVKEAHVSDYETTEEPATKSALDLLSRAAYRLSAADARLRGRATRNDQALSLPQARALAALAAEDGLTVAQLADAVEVSGAGTTQLLHRLERDGLVVRRRGQEKDQRVVTVHLTGAGRDRHESRAGFLDRRLAEVFSDLGNDEMTRTADALLRLAALYDEL